MMKLSRQTLAQLPGSIVKPGYDLADVTVGIVHLGIGAFHRAHQAVFTDDVLNNDPSWGICGVSLRSADTRDALMPQDGLYTLKVQDGEGEQLRVIGSIVEILVAPENPDAVLARMAAASTRIVSLTVTEKGYCHKPATGDLDESHPDIIHDLQNPNRPRSAIGFIVEALARRKASGIAPFTLLTCDNLPSNGHVLKRIVTQFAALRDPAIATYVATVAAPSTMVDRIVPATTDADRDAIATALGFTDAWPVVTEPFKQWVVEDNFPLGRPAWETAGVLFAEDVSVFELMKLRLLNGSHSTLAYLGFLAGAETVAQAMALPGMEPLVEDMMRDEISPTLPALAGFDLPAYRKALVERFNNPALRHRTYQIAMDGSQKLPQRLLGTIRDRLRSGEPIDRLSLGVAAWMRYVLAYDEKGAAIVVQDPLAGLMKEKTSGLKDAPEIVDVLLDIKQVFGDDLIHNEDFRARVVDALSRLLKDGAADFIRKTGGSSPR